MFYYEKNKVEVDGGLIRQNMHFTQHIQITPWQKEMMIEHMHQEGVAVDATFGTNENRWYIMSNT